MNRKKIIAVTGGNTGLGFALIRRLCQIHGDNALVFLLARDSQRGEDAIIKLNKEGLKPVLHILDVSQDESVKTFSDFIAKQYGGIDIFFHNAAARISKDLSQAQQVDNFINTNNIGTTRIINGFKHLLNNGARFVIIASSFGSLNNLAPTLHPKFNINAMSIKDVDKVILEYAQLVKKGEDKQNGWPEWMNIPSKIAQVAAMKIFANEMRKLAKEKNILINAACPGLMDTEASRPWFKDMSMAKQPSEAVDDVIWLSSIDTWEENYYGKLFQYKKLISWSKELN